MIPDRDEDIAALHDVDAGSARTPRSGRSRRRPRRRTLVRAGRGTSARRFRPEIQLVVGLGSGSGTSTWRPARGGHARRRSAPSPSGDTTSNGTDVVGVDGSRRCRRQNYSLDRCGDGGLVGQRPMSGDADANPQRRVSRQLRHGRAAYARRPSRPPRVIGLRSRTSGRTFGRPARRRNGAHMSIPNDPPTGPSADPEAWTA